MAISREKKAAVIDTVKAIAKNSASVVFVNFERLSVSDANAMRRSLAERGVGYTVAKKTLVRRALLDIKPKGEEPPLPGELALAYGDDLIAPSNGIALFGKTHKGKITIIGGIFDGMFKSREEMADIAAIPPLPTLRGMFVNVINSPVQGLVVALSEIAKHKQ